MRREGTVIKWKDDKGFGFIQPVDPGPEVFFHVADFQSAANVKPALRMRVSFELIQVGGKGPRAMAVQPATEAAVRHVPAARRSAKRIDRASGRPSASGALVALPLMFAYGALLAGSVWRGGLPGWVLAASFAINVITFFLYTQDKFSATQGTWRTREDTLHGASLLGGWPAAWVAQQLLRHKSAKPEFRAAYWGTVACHCAASGAALWFFGLLPPIRLG
jgi:uncharacterized membrane protein YsdA (DUF1294 family)/cold shock CspA family protein